jgi:hypothetical protein
MEGNMIYIRVLFAVFLLSVASGCAWQRIPPPPEYTVEAPLPLRVGVVLGDSQPSMYYGPGVLNEWKAMKLFESLIFPYRDGDQVDAVMKLSVDGGWKGQGAGAGFVIGLTLGLAGTAIGPSMTGTHDALAVLSKSADEAGRYSAHVSSTVEWGMTANTGEVSKKADELQRKRIAFELANKIRADRQALLSRLGK